MILTAMSVRSCIIVSASIAVSFVAGVGSHYVPGSFFESLYLLRANKAPFGEIRPQKMQGITRFSSLSAAAANVATTMRWGRRVVPFVSGECAVRVQM